MKKTIAFLCAVLLCGTAFCGESLLAPGKPWKIFGKHGSVSNGVLSFLHSPENKAATTRIRHDTVVRSQTPACTAVLKFDAEISGIAAAKKEHWSGGVVIIHGHMNGKYKSVKTIKVPEGSKSYAFDVPIPAGLSDLFVEFILQRAAGNMKIKNVVFEVKNSSQEKAK